VACSGTTLLTSRLPKRHYMKAWTVQLKTRVPVALNSIDLSTSHFDSVAAGNEVLSLTGWKVGWIPILGERGVESASPYFLGDLRSVVLLIRCLTEDGCLLGCSAV
jgi:hypothetical protein